eukprot:m.46200 g.46200  ORF g.46200 m.46200 type:complete len:523 (+) comp20171_c0_seq2:192-1760(+)
MGVEFIEGLGSTDLFKSVLSDAIQAVDPAAARAVSTEKKLRETYFEHLYDHVALQAVSTEAALGIAKAGMASLYSKMVYANKTTGTVLGVMEAIEQCKESFHTGVIRGSSVKKPPSVPYKGSILTGKHLVRQADAWATGGQIEPSAQEAIALTVSNPEVLSVENRVFVVIGAGAAMGPFQQLLALGATVVAIDIPVPQIWQRLIEFAQTSAGTLIFPTRSPCPESTDVKTMCEIAGVDVLEQFPALAQWLTLVAPGSQMTIGGYAYLDGAKFIKISVAMDAIAEYVRTHRDDVSLAYLCTPTDVHLRPQEAYDNYRERFNNRGWLEDLTAFVSRGRFCQKNETKAPVETIDGKLQYPVDSVVSQQGPNYALAKRLQHWRAMLARADGSVVSANIAPSSATHSVMKNKLLAAAYEGTKYFPPIEVFEPNTSNAVMTLMLLHDLNNGNSAAHPTTKLDNPLNLFTEGAMHGGFWRLGFSIRSVAELSAILHFWDLNIGKVRGAAAAVALLMFGLRRSSRFKAKL